MNDYLRRESAQLLECALWLKENDLEFTLDHDRIVRENQEKIRKLARGDIRLYCSTVLIPADKGDRDSLKYSTSSSRSTSSFFSSTKYCKEEEEEEEEERREP